MTVQPKVVGEWKKRLRGVAVTVAIVATVLILMLALPRDEADIRRQSKPSAEIQYTYVPTGSSEAIQVTLLPREDRLVELVGIDREFSETMPAEAFFDGRWSDPVVVRIEEENDIFAILILMIFFFPLAYVIVSGIFSWFRNRRLRRILRL